MSAKRIRHVIEFVPPCFFRKYLLDKDGKLIKDCNGGFKNVLYTSFFDEHQQLASSIPGSAEPNNNNVDEIQRPAQNADENQQLAPAISNSAEPNNNNVDDEAQEIGQDIKNDFDLMFDTNEERSNSNTFDEFDFFCF